MKMATVSTSAHGTTVPGRRAAHHNKDPIRGKHTRSTARRLGDRVTFMRPNNLLFAEMCGLKSEQLAALCKYDADLHAFFETEAETRASMHPTFQRFLSQDFMVEEYLQGPLYSALLPGFIDPIRFIGIMAAIALIHISALNLPAGQRLSFP